MFKRKGHQNLMTDLYAVMGNPINCSYENADTKETNIS